MQDIVGAGFLGLSWLLSEPLPSGHSDLDLSIDWSDAVHMQQRSTNIILELKRLIETTERGTETATPASVVAESARQQHEAETQRTQDNDDHDGLDDGTCLAPYGKCAVPYMAYDEHKYAPTTAAALQAPQQHERATDAILELESQAQPMQQRESQASPEKRAPEIERAQLPDTQAQRVPQPQSKPPHIQQCESQLDPMLEFDDARSVSPLPYMPWRDFKTAMQTAWRKQVCKGEYFVPVKYADPYWIRLDLESGKLAGFQDCEWCITKLLHDIGTHRAPYDYRYGEALTCARCDELVHPGHDSTATIFNIHTDNMDRRMRENHISHAQYYTMMHRATYNSHFRSVSLFLQSVQ